MATIDMSAEWTYSQQLKAEGTSRTNTGVLSWTSSTSGLAYSSITGELGMHLAILDKIAANTNKDTDFSATFKDTSNYATLDANGKVNQTANNAEHATEADNDGNGNNLASFLVSGWLPYNQSCAYQSADSPTFVMRVSVDITVLLCPGMRIKLTQTSAVKYFIVVAVSAYTFGHTDITMYGGTDYMLTNDAISSVYFSAAKAPLGFPLNPNKWSVEIKLTSDAAQTNPSTGTWYNIPALNLSLPIGTWNVEYNINAMVQRHSIGSGSIYCTLTSSGSGNQSDTELTAEAESYIGTGDYADFVSPIYKRKFISMVAKTQYLFEMWTLSSGVTALQINGSTGTTVVRAACAYL